MTSKTVFDKKVESINVKRTAEAAVINAAITATIADFDQYHGISLLKKDPITGEDTEYTTLSVDTSTYNGTTLNAIKISLNGGSTVFATVVAHADDVQYTPPRLYYSTTKRILDGTKEGADGGGPITGAEAYDIITGLGIQSIVDPE